VGELASRQGGEAGLVASVLYLCNQGDILATAVPGFPVFDLAGFIGSSLWGLWVIALGVAILRAPARHPTADPVSPRSGGGDPGARRGRRQPG
jgi:hypothetical protein